jgi:hypothetical protein
MQACYSHAGGITRLRAPRGGDPEFEQAPAVPLPTVVIQFSGSGTEFAGARGSERVRSQCAQAASRRTGLSVLKICVCLVDGLVG